MTQEEELIRDLSSKTAATAAIALAEYASFWDSVVKLPELDDATCAEWLARLRFEAHERALVLLSLARAMDEYGTDIDRVGPDDDPRILLPLVQKLGESYAVVALARAMPELQIGVLFSPDSMREALGPEVADFIRQYGQEQAAELLRRQAASPPPAPAQPAPAQPAPAPAPAQPAPAPAQPAQPVQPVQQEIASEEPAQPDVVVTDPNT